MLWERIRKSENILTPSYTSTLSPRGLVQYVIPLQGKSSRTRPGITWVDAGFKPVSLRVVDLDRKRDTMKCWARCHKCVGRLQRLPRCMRWKATTWNIGMGCFEIGFEQKRLKFYQYWYCVEQSFLIMEWDLHGSGNVILMWHKWGYILWNVSLLSGRHPRTMKRISV